MTERPGPVRRHSGRVLHLTVYTVFTVFCGLPSVDNLLKLCDLGAKAIS
jgi:hypothetical protein